MRKVGKTGYTKAVPMVEMMVEWMVVSKVVYLVVLRVDQWVATKAASMVVYLAVLTVDQKADSKVDSTEQQMVDN